MSKIISVPSWLARDLQKEPSWFHATYMIHCLDTEKRFTVLEKAKIAMKVYQYNIPAGHPFIEIDID